VGAEGSEVILVRACPDRRRGRDRSWKHFTDGTGPKTVDSCVSSRFFDQIDPRSEARHPDTIVGIQYQCVEVWIFEIPDLNIRET